MRHLAVIPLVVPLVTTLALPLAFGCARAAPLAAHHAVYSLTLDTSRTEDVVAARGTMTYDVAESCTAWTTSQHLVIDMTNTEGQDVHMVSDYATLESKDGTRLDFHTRQVTDQAVTEKLDGTATLDRPGGHGHADFTSPQKTTVALPQGTLLPMAHTSAVLDAAAAHKRFLAVPLFDGTGADGAQDTFVTILSWSKSAPQKWAALAALPSGRVHIAFFDRGPATQTPDYEIGMTYYYNGVSDALAMNFGNFLMNGRLDQLDVRPSLHC